MGTRLDCVLPGIDQNTGDEIFGLVKAEISRLENKMSRFLPNSELTYINKSAAEKNIGVDREWITVLKLCKYYFSATLNCFDITLRKIAGEENYSSGGTDKIIINENENTIYFSDPELKIDLGGFGKGYALDKVKKILKRYNVIRGIVSFGESSVLAIGRHPRGNKWKIGIQNLFRPGENVCSFDLENNNLSTSGMLARKGKLLSRDNPVINPSNGKPVTEIKTVSVKSETATDAEVLSTALYASSPVKSKKILSNFPGSEAIEAVYDNDGKVSIFVLG